MSRLWSGDAAVGAVARPAWARSDATDFTPWPFDRARIERELAELMPHAAVAQPPAPDAEAIRAEGFAAGVEAAMAQAEAIIEGERAAARAIAESLATLKPEPTDALAALLAETVDRLVRGIVGEVAIDRALLADRCAAAAAMIGEETAPATLHVSPDDLERLAGAALPVTLAADPALASGALRLESARGWIEDGPAVRLDRLRHALDAMGAVR